MKTFPILPMLLAVLLTAVSAMAAPPAEPLPIEVSSRQLVSEQAPRRLIFTGEVVARQGDVILYCQELQVLYGGDAQDRIERIEALRDVRLVQGERIATGDHAVYEPQLGTVVLTGNATAHSGQDRVSGERITVFLNEERSQVEGDGDSRVKATVFPQAEKP